LIGGLKARAEGRDLITPSVRKNVIGRSRGLRLWIGAVIERVHSKGNNIGLRVGGGFWEETESFSELNLVTTIR